MQTHRPDTTVETSESRVRILDVAHALFVEHGYRAVSMQQIAAAACIKKPTLYHHFRDKEALFVAVMDLMMDRSHDAIARAIDSGTTLREQLRNIATQAFSSTRHNFGRLYVDLNEQVSSESREWLRARHEPVWTLLQPAIRAAIASGEVREVDEAFASKLFFTMIWGHIWHASAQADQLDAEYAARLVDMFMDGLSTRPAAH